MRVVIGDRFRRWSSSSIAFRRWVTGILLVTHDSSVRPSPHSPRNRRQFLAREASAAVGGFVHPQLTGHTLHESPYLTGARLTIGRRNVWYPPTKSPSRDQSRQPHSVTHSIPSSGVCLGACSWAGRGLRDYLVAAGSAPGAAPLPVPSAGRTGCTPRSEEHTSELQSLRHLVCRLLL